MSILARGESAYRPAIRRLHAIIRILVEAKHVITAEHIARALEVSTKSVYRDMDFLRSSLGVNMETNSDGGRFNGFRLIDSTCPFCKKATLKNVALIADDQAESLDALKFRRVKFNHALNEVL